MLFVEDFLYISFCFKNKLRKQFCVGLAVWGLYRDAAVFQRRAPLQERSLDKGPEQGEAQQQRQGHRRLDGRLRQDLPGNGRE